MLNVVEGRAKQLGCVVVSETASQGRAGRTPAPAELLANFDPEALPRRLTWIIGPLGTGTMTWSTAETHVADAGQRNQIELPGLRELATTVQHAFGEERELVL